MSHRTPKELIELYWKEVWGNCNPEMIREICADPILRHDPGGSTTALSHDEQIARISQQGKKFEPFFEHEVLLADDTHVTSVWNMRSRTGDDLQLCGIEVFRAENGKFTHCWNSSYEPGRWGRERDSSVADDLPPPEFISSVDEVTTDWMQRVFQAAGIDAPRISIVAPEQIGHGNLSEAFRTRITYNGDAADAAPSVICKLSTQIPEAIEYAKTFHVNSREVSAYEVLADSGVHAPRAFMAQATEDDGGINLVLEDLSQRTRAGDQMVGCTPEEAQAVVAEFARLHCHFWNDQNIAKAPWIYNRAGYGQLIDDTQAGGAAAYRERFDGRIDDHYLTRAEGFVGKMRALTERNFIPRTLVHGESRADNILFEDTDDGPIAWLIDWQFADFGSPMFDTAYFLAGSMLPDERKACEEDLIAMQQAEIAKVDPCYTLELAKDEYARSLIFPFFMTVSAILAMPKSERGDQMLTTLLTRNVDAMDHWGVDPDG